MFEIFMISRLFISTVNLNTWTKLLRNKLSETNCVIETHHINTRMIVEYYNTDNDWKNAGTASGRHG